jgi:colanic acid biosynthesis glycosyl transferase WcaI
MRILFLNQAFYPDHVATAQHAHDLAKHLVLQGHDVAVIASRSIYGDKGATLPKREMVDGIEIHRVGGSLFGKASIFARIIDFALFYVLATAKALLIKRPDVIVPFTTPPFIALVGWLMQVTKRCKYVYWVMDLYPDLPVKYGVFKPNGLTARFFEQINRFCMRRADRVVVLGRCTQGLVIGKGVPQDKIALIGPWADMDELEPVSREDNPLREAWGLNDKFVVMYSGNLGLAHDIDTLGQAMLRLKDRDEMRFVFVGSGKRMTLMREFVDANRLTNVIFKPYQPREKIRESLSLADLHMISLSEPMTGILVPSKLFGIMAAGRASVFIGSPESQISLILTESGCGKTIRVGDGNGLTQSINELAGDRAACDEMGSLARKAMADTYDRRHMCVAWERLLNECVSGRKPDVADDTNQGATTSTPAKPAEAHGSKS